MKRKRPSNQFRFQVTVERDTIKYDLAQQTLSFDYTDRDQVIFTGTIEQKNLFDELCQDYAVELRKERAMQLRKRKLHR